ncbi:MAG: DUF998 domain-containing protein [Thermoplasmata archaeon]
MPCYSAFCFGPVTDQPPDRGPPHGPVPPDVRRLLWIVVSEIILYVVLDVVAQLLPPHYSAITQAESDLAVGPYGFIMAINFVNRGVLSLLFLYALYRTLNAGERGWEPFRRGAAFLAVWGVGALLLAAFPTDVPSTPLSWHGTIHLVVALLAFIGGAVGVFLLASHFERNEFLKEAGSFALPLAALALVLLVVELGAGIAVPRLSVRIGGLTERLFLGSILGWILLVSLYLLRQPAQVLTSGSGRSPPTRAPT